MQELRVGVPHNLRGDVPDGSPQGAANGLPSELSALLRARDDVSRERAWEQFLEKYSRLLLHTVRTRSGTYDEAMERYVFVLQCLREEEFVRLRRYTPEDSARFTTWLVVVTGRMCIDYFRKQYGYPAKSNGEDPALQERLEARRRLADLVCEKLEVSQIRDRAERGPEIELRRTELESALVQVIEALPARDRLLLRLRFYQGLTAREVASSMGFATQFHVYRRLNAVLADLRTGLVEIGIASPRP